MRKYLILFFIIFSGLETFASQKATKPIPGQTSKVRTISSQMQSLPCEEQVLSVLGQLEAPLEWLTVSTSNSSIKSFKSQTTKPEIVLELEVGAQEVRLTRSSTGKKIRYQFSTQRDCKTEVNINIAKSHSRSQLFTDFDLKQILESRKPADQMVIFYVWSPQMNLSIKGLAEISKLTNQLKLKLIGLVDPNAQDAEITKVLSRLNLPLSLGQRVDSDILKQRNALLHFPNLMIVKKGEFFGEIRPGYDVPVTLKKYLEKVIYED